MSGAPLKRIGGRYDGLVKGLWPHTVEGVAPPMSAVGLTLNAERLMGLVLPIRVDRSQGQLHVSQVTLLCLHLFFVL